MAQPTDPWHLFKTLRHTSSVTGRPCSFELQRVIGCSESLAASAMAGLGLLSRLCTSRCLKQPLSYVFCIHGQWGCQWYVSGQCNEVSFVKLLLSAQHVMLSRNVSSWFAWAAQGGDQQACKNPSGLDEMQLQATTSTAAFTGDTA